MGRPTLQRPPRAAIPAAIPLADLGDPPPPAIEKASIPTAIMSIEGVEELIAAAGEPEDEHSLRALTFLQTELVRKRAMLDGL